MNTLIEAKNLNKAYGNFVALDNINFNIERGQIVGLIGPNGAGKTTLLKSILGLTPSSGHLSVLGQNPRKHRNKLMQKMCFIADVAILPRWLKVADALTFVEGVHPLFNKSNALAFLEKTDIPLNSKVKALSKGMVVQLHLSLIMAIDTDILILDEPTLGLDIIYRKQFYNSLLSDYFTENRTIVITTHQVEEIESILTHLMFINKSKFMLDCSMDKFSERFIQVMAHPGKEKELQAYKPIATNKQFGKMIYLFEDTPKDMLATLGEISIPSVSDVFVAKILGERS